MPEMDGSTKPPQISEMFQKFAFALKSKTLEFFADDDEAGATTTAGEGFSLLDSAEEFLTDQKVVVIKPDHPIHNIPDAHFTQTLISSLFATISSFEASYLQLQTAHVPIDEEAIKAADRALVSHLQKVSDIRKLYQNFRRNPSFNSHFPIESCVGARVQENQSKLRALETMVNQLQSDIDVKDDEVLELRKKLASIQQSNSKLSTKFSKHMKLNQGTEVLLTIQVFNSMLGDACRELHCFTKVLINLMKKAGWDLELAANTVHPGVVYAKKGHNRYALLSYVCLVMFRGFDLEDFGLHKNGILCNGNGSVLCDNRYLKQLIEHVSGNPIEVLRNDPSCDFSRFCEGKYEQLIHPTMESSIFSSLDHKEVVLDSWKSLSVFYELFVKMASSVWLLHKLAYSFDPVVEIFQVERGVDFSVVYMEDVRRRGVFLAKARPKVGFTVLPGFKIGRTIIQSQVYLTGLKCTE